MMLDHVEKRPAMKFSSSKNDVYINRNSAFPVQLERAYKLLNEGETIVIHGLGAAIHRAINIALQLQQRFADTLTVIGHVV